MFQSSSSFLGLRRSDDSERLFQAGKVVERGSGVADFPSAELLRSDRAVIKSADFVFRFKMNGVFPWFVDDERVTRVRLVVVVDESLFFLVCGGVIDFARPFVGCAVQQFSLRALHGSDHDGLTCL